MTKFHWPIRVYYEDTDTGGVVYHARYLYFMERARTEWLRDLGFEQDHLRDEYQCLFAVHSMQIEFKQPARFNDALVVINDLQSSRSASLVFEQKILRGDELLCQAEVKVACLHAEQFKPMAIPSFMLTRLRGER